jgi:hypothetical protein
MSEQDFHTIFWRALIMIVTAYGQWRGFCKEIKIIKDDCKAPTKGVELDAG